MDGSQFWEGFFLALARKYDLSKVGRVIVSGDGAPWVKEGAALLSDIYELERKPKKLLDLRGYPMENSFGLRDLPAGDKR